MSLFPKKVEYPFRSSPKNPNLLTLMSFQLRLLFYVCNTEEDNLKCFNHFKLLSIQWKAMGFKTTLCPAEINKKYKTFFKMIYLVPLKGC